MVKSAGRSLSTIALLSAAMIGSAASAPNVPAPAGNVAARTATQELAARFERQIPHIAFTGDEQRSVDRPRVLLAQWPTNTPAANPPGTPSNWTQMSQQERVNWAARNAKPPSSPPPPRQPGAQFPPDGGPTGSATESPFSVLQRQKDLPRRPAPSESPVVNSRGSTDSRGWPQYDAPSRRGSTDSVGSRRGSDPWDLQGQRAAKERREQTDRAIGARDANRAVDGIVNPQPTPEERYRAQAKRDADQRARQRDWQKKVYDDQAKSKFKPGVAYEEPAGTPGSRWTSSTSGTRSTQQSQGTRDNSRTSPPPLKRQDGQRDLNRLR